MNKLVSPQWKENLSKCSYCHFLNYDKGIGGLLGLKIDIQKAY